ncbi:MAG TPA: cellulase family glycosylhydrolase [Bacteroidales bacterium]|nr:cellulase family glycosylhydrolase [Bacteroidales bacterium]
MKKSAILILMMIGIIVASCEKDPVITEPVTKETPADPPPHPDPAEPVSLNNENPHYFEFRNQPAILITSGEHYGAVINRDFDYIPYLDELMAHGFNLTRLFAGAYVEFAGWYNYDSNQPLSPAAGRFICPWQRSSEPGYINGGNRFDLTKWDEEYFTRLKDFVSQAAERGVIVELSFFTSYYNSTYAGSSDDPELLWKYSPLYKDNNINGIGDVPRTEALSMTNEALQDVQDAYIRKIVTELKNYDNIIYEICNEPYIQELASDQWQAHIAGVIEQTESDFGYRHLITQNISNGARQVTYAIPGASVFNFHYSNPRAIALNYDLDRVIGNNETDGLATNRSLRFEAWDFILGGGGLFNNLDMSFTPDSPHGGQVDGERNVLRNELSILKKFIESFNFITMKPDNSFLSGDAPQGYESRILSDPGKAWALYLRKSDLSDTVKRTVRLDVNLPAGVYLVRWINTKTGEMINQATIDASDGITNLRSPEFTTDIALDLRSKKE